MANVLLEICCGSAADAVAAENGGADRVELCSALESGGLTPSAGTIAEVKSRLKIPVMVMLRPRAGGFCYSDVEMAVIERDARLALDAGADGVVFGILHEDGTVDEERCQRVMQIANSRQTVFHRAIDVTPDPFRALDQIAGMGCTRILTSGQRPSAADESAMRTIRSLIEYSRGRIEILPGAGMRVENISNVIAHTGCRQVHLTAFMTAYDHSTRQRPEIVFSAEPIPEDQYQITDSQLVQRIARLLKGAAGEAP